jgi:hypothetical protein
MNANRIALFRTLQVVVILALALSVSTTVSAAPASPFLGHWTAADVDGSDMTLNVGGPPSGPFQLTWTDDYISYCGREPGIVRGTGWLNEGDANLLEADVHLECFTTGDTLDFHVTFRYHPATNKLSLYYFFGQVTIWNRPGGPEAAPPVLNLRVNYGHDWVESFYEGGHTAWVTVTDGDGNLKATAELVTEPKDFWGGETGFQTATEDWVPGPPDIQPNDWVYGWVDNGASAQVQVGDISGAIDLEADSIGGTVLAPWFSDEVQVECLDWGSGQDPPFDNKDGGSILADGLAPYSCSWAGEWDIQPGQTIGVGYSEPDGHWVANAFSIPNPTFVAYLPVTIVGYGWPMGDTIAISINSGEYAAEAEVGNAEWDPAIVLFELWRDDFSMEAGDHIVMADEAAGLTKDVWVTNLAVTDFDLNAEKAFGTYDPAYSLWVWLYDLDGQVPETDPDAGTWTATFTELPPDAWGGATQWDEDGDGTSIDFQVPRVMAVGNFEVEWSSTNPEEVINLSWNGSGNLTNAWTHPDCSGDLEFFGNSWVSENEGTSDFFFASLAGWGTTGSWSKPSGYVVDIGSISSGCPGSADIPIATDYQFFADKPDLIMVQRTFDFGSGPYAHDLRAFIPRLFPANGFTEVIHPNASGDQLITEGTCGYGCIAASWDGSWFAINNPSTGLGMIVQSTSFSTALWLDDDGGSLTNSSSVLLLQPPGGFTGTVTDTEYLCFYDSSSWTPSLTPPAGCQP